jgi:hypothetical protein
MTDEMVDDIEKWSDARLKQWFADSVMRYELVDVFRSIALTRSTATLMMALGQLLAGVDVSPDVAGAHLVEVIKRIRHARVISEAG